MAAHPLSAASAQSCLSPARPLKGSPGHRQPVGKGSAWAGKARAGGGEAGQPVGDLAGEACGGQDCVILTLPLLSRWC